MRLPQIDPAEVAREQAEVAAGRLPPRYGDVWEAAFVAAVEQALRPGARILDVGSGAHPTLSEAMRPEGAEYVGLDVSAHELDRAGPGAYDRTLVADISAGPPEGIGQFDLVMSWQVLEHVPSMAGALDAQRRLLAPGGKLVAMLSGGNAFFALAARVIPYPVSTRLQRRLLGVAEADKFPTAYDACTDRALRRLLAAGDWATWEITPLYKAGGYLTFSPALRRAYLVYENWAARKPRPNLATHYVLDATAPRQASGRSL